ncbi:MAG: lipoprotein, partial [Abditibacteriaceae bacterium]
MMRRTIVAALTAIVLSGCTAIAKPKVVQVEAKTVAVEKNALVIVDNGNTSAQVVVAPDAGEWEKQAANDLVKYIAMMSGATPTLDNTAASAAAAMDVKTPVLIVGQA